MKKTNSTYKLLISIIFFNAIYTTALFGQNDSLQSYVDIASKNNPLVMQRYYEYQASTQKINQVGSLPNPELNAGIFISPMEVINGNQIAEFQLMQMFPWFGVIKNAKEEMNLMAQAKYELYTDAILQTELEVKQVWYELYKMNREILYLKQNLKILNTIESIIVNQFSSNSSNSSMGNPGNSNSLPEYYRLQMNKNDLENKILNISDQLVSMTVKFNTMLNRPVHSLVSYSDTLLPDSMTVSLITMSDSILHKNPKIAMVELEQKSLESRKKMIKAMGYPMVGIGIQYSLINKSPMSQSEMNGRDMFMPMISVSIPLYRKKYNAMRNETVYLQSASEQELISMSNELQTMYYESLQRFNDSERRIKLYTKQSELANKSLNLMIAGFSASNADLREILEMQKELLEFQFMQTEAIVDYNSSIAAIKRLVRIDE